MFLELKNTTFQSIANEKVVDLRHFVTPLDYSNAAYLLTDRQT